MSAAPPAAFEIDHAAEVAALNGDSERGARVFRVCVSCHQIDAPKNRTGPHLIGVFGRQAGSLEDYRYSLASRESGVVWSVETLSAYLRDTRGFMPGTKMNFAGVDAEELADLLTYLFETGGVAPPPEAQPTDVP